MVKKTNEKTKSRMVIMLVQHLNIGVGNWSKAIHFRYVPANHFLTL